MEYKIVTFRIPEDMVESLDTVAEEHDRSRNKVVELLLRRGLDAYREDGILVARMPIPSPAVQQAAGLHFDRKLSHLTGGAKESKKQRKR